MRGRLVVVWFALCAAIASAGGCNRAPAAETAPNVAVEPTVSANSSYHDQACRPERHEGFVSDFPCAFDSDCLACSCAPVNRTEHARLGGDAYCERFNRPPAREECIATNPACCEGRCVLAR
jgi:hypothetical protein